MDVVTVTGQLVVFGNYRYAHVDYYRDQTAAFHHFFIKEGEVTTSSLQN
jgi:hypothetical protein